MKITHTMKAKQDFPAEGIKKGESYFEWQIKGVRYRSKTHPARKSK